MGKGREPKTMYHVGDTVRVTRLSRIDDKIGEIEVGGTYIIDEAYRRSVCVTTEGIPEYILINNQIEKVEPESEPEAGE